jgi:hypothetical protein
MTSCFPLPSFPLVFVVRFIFERVTTRVYYHIEVSLMYYRTLYPNLLFCTRVRVQFAYSLHHRDGNHAMDSELLLEKYAKFMSGHKYYLMRLPTSTAITHKKTKRSKRPIPSQYGKITWKRLDHSYAAVSPSPREVKTVRRLGLPSSMHYFYA